MNFCHTLFVSAAFKRCGEKCCNNGFCNIEAYKPLANSEYVGVVVLPRKTRHVFGQTICSANTCHFVCGYGNTNAASADQDPKLGVASSHSFGSLDSEIGIIHRIFGVCANVVDGVSLFAQKRSKVLFIAESGVVTAKNNCHNSLSG
jgi:hypothetical protein